MQSVWLLSNPCLQQQTLTILSPQAQKTASQFFDRIEQIPQGELPYIQQIL